MKAEYVVMLGKIYLTEVRPGRRGYGFSSELDDARLYSLDRAERIARDLIERKLALDPADVTVVQVQR